MIEIEINGKKLQYDFNKLTVEQGEFAREICEFKVLQTEADALNLDDIFRSGGAEWKMKACRYLFNLEGKKYDRGYAETELYHIIRNLDIAESVKLEEAVKDFFTNMGSEQKLSMLFRTEKSKNVTMELLKLMIQNRKSE